MVNDGTDWAVSNPPMAPAIQRNFLKTIPPPTLKYEHLDESISSQVSSALRRVRYSNCFHLHDDAHSPRMQPLLQALRSRKDPQSVRVRRTPAGPLRPSEGQGKLEPGVDSQRSVQHVALCAGAAGLEAVGDRIARRRNDAADPHAASGSAAGRAGPVGEGRRRQPDRIVQGARPFLRDLDVRRSWA